MDELDRLRCFVRSAELGSFSSAARDARLGPSAVSRAIARLEAELGAALFNRSTRRLHLTEVGDAFLERARRVLSELADARAVASDLNRVPRGILRLNCPGAFGRRHVVPYLPAFAAAYPEIGLDVTLTDDTVDLIGSGSDVAIRIGALADSGLVARRLAPHRRVLCAAPEFVANHAPIETAADLARRPALLFSLQADRWMVVDPSGHRTRIAVAGRIRTNDSEALLRIAIAGLGIALLPTWIASQAVTTGTLVRVLPGHTAMFTEGEQFVWAVYPPKRIVSPKVRVFIDGFAAHIGTPPYWDRAPPIVIVPGTPE